MYCGDIEDLFVYHVDQKYEVNQNPTISIAKRLPNWIPNKLYEIKLSYELYDIHIDIQIT